MSRSLDLLTVKVGANMVDVLKGLDRVAARADKLGRDMKRVGTSLTRNLSAPLAAVGAAAVLVGVKVGNAADQLLDLEQQTGLSTDALQEFRRVATVAGVEQDTLGKAAQQLTMRMSRGAEGSADMRDALRQLGISATDASGNLRPMDAVVNEAIAGLSSMENITQRNVLATKLFSRSAVDLAPILGLSADELKRAREEAHEMGLVLNRESLVAANDFRVQVDTLTESLKAQGMQLGIALIPALQSATAVLTDRLLPAVQGAVKWVGSLDTSTVLVAAAIAGIAAAAGPAIVALGMMVSAVGTLAGAFVAMNVALAATPAGWILFGTVAVGVIVGVIAKKLSEMAKGLREATAASKAFNEHASTTVLNMQLLMALNPEKFGELPEHMRRLAMGLPPVNDGLAETGTTLRELVIPAIGEVNEGLLRMHSVELPSTVAVFEGLTPVLQGVANEGVDSMNTLGGSVGNVALQGAEAFVDFASGANNAIGSFVKNAMAQLAKLLARMLVIKAVMSFLPGVGNFLGLEKFAGGFATGGHIPAGQFGLVGEAGRPEVVSSPSFVSGPANVTPMSGGGTTVLQLPAPRSAFERIAQDYMAETLRQLEHNGFRVQRA